MQYTVRFREIRQVRRFVKIFCLILAVQMGCVAFGLWVYHRYVVSATIESSKELAWEELGEIGNDLFAKLDKSKANVPLPNATSFGRLRERIESADLPDWSRILVVDSGWRILFQYPGKNRNSTPESFTGEIVSWEEQRGQTDVVTHFDRGTLKLDEESYLGLVYPLSEPENVEADERKGHLLILRSMDDLKASPAEIVRSLPMVSLVAFCSICGLLSLSMYLLLKRIYDDLSKEKAGFVRKARQQEQALIRTRDAIVFGLAKLADSRDRDTGWHLERMSLYSTRLASELQNHPSFRDVITPIFVRLIEPSSVLHDIGKVGIEDRILLKPGPLTDDERAKMQTHAAIGGECLKQIERRLGESNFLQMAREIAFHHHERWDGTGYPLGLLGEKIPLSARIVAIADVYDALTNIRPYKEAFPHQLAVSIIRSEAGQQFDPRLVEVFLQIESQFAEIAGRYHADELAAEDDDQHNLVSDDTDEAVTVCGLV